jgi:hypothetical protein
MKKTFIFGLVFTVVGLAVVMLALALIGTLDSFLKGNTGAGLTETAHVEVPATLIAGTLLLVPFGLCAVKSMVKTRDF